MTEEYNGDPWTVGTELKLRQKPGVTLISLLTDEAGALLVAQGKVPAYLRQQAKEALEWSCTEARAPARDRPLFDVLHEDDNTP